ncbi:hypothetical protein, partial [Microbulbifer sp. NBRC 101763]|uniref:hypothetical protein n=1 Tax=Microbulbifer sp. NBRC 101763 TaxID=1113820 RepID=UPI0033429CFB
MIDALKRNKRVHLTSAALRQMTRALGTQHGIGREKGFRGCFQAFAKGAPISKERRDLVARSKWIY